MEIAIAIFIGAWISLASGFSVWMVFRDYNKELKKKQNINKEQDDE